MRKEYNLKNMKEKRRGLPSGLQGKTEKQAKIKITITLDADVIEYFKNKASVPGALAYQTQINQALRRAMGSATTSNETETLKAVLLKDKEFIKAVAKQAKRN